MANLNDKVEVRYSPRRKFVELDRMEFPLSVASQ